MTASGGSRRFKRYWRVKAVRRATTRRLGPFSLHWVRSPVAMGDLNATVFAQTAHVALLRRFGGMCESEMMVYRGLPPRGKTWEGIVIDDHAIAAVTPKGASGAPARSTRRARELFSAGAPRTSSSASKTLLRSRRKAS